MHCNSLLAYHQGIHTFNAMELQIYKCYESYGKPLTDRQVKALLRFNEEVQYRPRITMLIKSGVLCECGKDTDKVTGKTVRLVRIKERNEGQTWLSFVEKDECRKEKG